MKFPLQRMLQGAAGLLTLALAACSTTGVSLDYQPRLAQTLPGPRMVSLGRFSDIRGDGPYQLGSVRPAGLPIDQVTTFVPVDQVVRNSFAYGLKTRQMLSTDSAPYVLTGEIIQFKVDQVVRPEAVAEIRITLLRAGTGKVVYSKVWKADQVDQPYMPWSGSPVPKLREMASRALQEVVDRSLDDVVFRSNLQPAADHPVDPLR